MEPESEGMSSQKLTGVICGEWSDVTHGLTFP
jgi:hypothetical protein